MDISELYRSLPNLITLARLVLAPLAVSMIVSQRYVEAFVIFVAAGVSDAVDGFIAKRFHLQSELGAYLDPLADKALLISIFVTLAIVGVVHPALAILIVSRDLMILFGILIAWLLGKPVTIKPAWVGKFTTAAQIAFAAFVLGARAADLDPGLLLYVGEWVVAVATMLSFGLYAGQWFEHMNS